MERFIIEKGNFTLTSTAGLGLVGIALERYTDIKFLDKKLPYHHGILHSDILKTYVGLLCQGKSDFEASSGLKEDLFFQQAMGLSSVPSHARLRQRMDEYAKIYESTINQGYVDFLSKAKPKFSRTSSGHIPLDVDATLLDNSYSKKEGVTASYKRIHGYMPLAGYFGAEGYCLGFELRPGNQHGQTGARAFLKKLIKRAHQVSPRSKILFRMDAAHDATENFIELEAGNEVHTAGIDYLIKWNPRNKLLKEEKDYWCQVATQKEAWVKHREGYKEAIFDITAERFIKGTQDGGTYRRIMRLREFTIDENGQQLMFPEITLEGWWTSLDLSCREVIELYNARGTSEQFHSEFKTDLDIERLPSGKFATNSLVLSCAVLAYNILRWMGQNGLVGRKAPIRNPAKRRRIKTVMQHLMYVAAMFIKSGRRLKIKFSRNSSIINIYHKLYYRTAYG